MWQKRGDFVTTRTKQFCDDEAFYKPMYVILQSHMYHNIFAKMWLYNNKLNL